MLWHKATLVVTTNGKGLYSITADVNRLIGEWQITEGLCHLFIQHTSASLVVSENYDPSARQDLESFMDRLVPESQPWQVHTLEGADDSPSHMRAMLTHTSLSIPIEAGALALGTWQGVYVFEHRRSQHRRRVALRGLGIA